jgi:RNA polymerase sigma-70 factor (ECF subfamily)
VNGDKMKTDGELVGLALQKRQDAFDALVERHYASVFSVAYARTAERDSAQDICQEAFLRAYLNLASLADPSRFAQWVCRIARNLAMDDRRRSETHWRLAPRVVSESALENIADPRQIDSRKEWTWRASAMR